MSFAKEEHKAANSQNGGSYSTLSNYHGGAQIGGYASKAKRPNYYVVPHFGGHDGGYNTLQHGGGPSNSSSGHFTQARAYSNSNDCKRHHENTFSAKPTSHCG